MIHKGVVEGLATTRMSTNGQCKDCIMGKQARQPFNAVVEPETEPYERVAFDLWGPAQVQTTGGKTMMMVATDQAGAECKAWYLSNKAKETTIVCLESFDVRVETQRGVLVKCIWTDGGGEFENDLWVAYCQKRGI